uniref:Uncharacterized protein n=1 Tax=Solanum tuberosum TaxID=4113 RepID=M0ZS58_SOLTU
MAEDNFQAKKRPRYHTLLYKFHIQSLGENQELLAKRAVDSFVIACLDPVPSTKPVFLWSLCLVGIGCMLQKLDGEGAAMYDAVVALSEAMIELAKLDFFGNLRTAHTLISGMPFGFDQIPLLNHHHLITAVNKFTSE